MCLACGIDRVVGSVVKYEKACVVSYNFLHFYCNIYRGADGNFISSTASGLRVELRQTEVAGESRA